MAMFAIFVLLVGSYFNLPGSFRFYWVQSGSMEPAIKTGSLIVLQQNASYAVGDIITFKSESERNENNPKRTTTHRIVSETSKDGQIQYQTKGDANDIADIDSVDPRSRDRQSHHPRPLLGTHSCVCPHPRRSIDPHSYTLHHHRLSRITKHQKRNY
jgi:signal peptidase I